MIDFFIVLADRHVVSHILNQSQPVFVLRPPYCIVINYAPLVKRRNFSHSWKKSQIFNRDSCKNLLLWTFKGTLYYLPHMLTEYNTWIDNLTYIYPSICAQKNAIYRGIQHQNVFFWSNWWTIIHTAFHWYRAQNKAILFEGNKSYYGVLHTDFI